jgi:hypothetical protein
MERQKRQGYTQKKDNGVKQTSNKSKKQPHVEVPKSIYPSMRNKGNKRHHEVNTGCI